MASRAAMLAGLKPGRKVQCNVRGRVFWCTLLTRSQGGWQVTPPKGITYHHVTTQQIRAAAPRWHPADTQVRS